MKSTKKQYETIQHDEIRRKAKKCTVPDCGAVYVTVDGEPTSKANNRRLVTINGKPRFIKSKRGIELAKQWEKECPVLKEPIKDDIVAYIKLFYTTRRPDLDESLILDLLQGKLIVNDRQVRERHTFWGLDKSRPRSVILLRPMASCSCSANDGCLFKETFGTCGSV